ncbi:hypothetical protein CaCOL14_013085 [Colletotrichum acutatum]
MCEPPKIDPSFFPYTLSLIENFAKYPENKDKIAYKHNSRTRPFAICLQRGNDD